MNRTINPPADPRKLDLFYRPKGMSAPLELHQEVLLSALHRSALT